MTGIMLEIAKRRALEAMLGGTVTSGSGDWTVEVELVARWTVRGNRWSALRHRRGFWREFFHPIPAERLQTWRTERKSISFKQTPRGFVNDSDVGFDLVGIPPAPKGSDGWTPFKVNIYRDADLMFWCRISDSLVPKFITPGNGIAFAPNAIAATLEGVGG